jgi:hypothetical protein
MEIEVVDQMPSEQLPQRLAMPPQTMGALLTTQMMYLELYMETYHFLWYLNFIG